MALREELFAYLDRFGRTVPVRDLHQRSDARAMVALRHDVDYDLDAALELAFHEAARGCRASFFLLHTASYWNDPQLAEKCLQLQDFGHEVGIHLNLLPQWIAGEIDDPGARLPEILAPLRAAGVEISGVSSHGARECYQHGVINYWIFRELRPERPEATEDCRTAEGPLATGDDKPIPYPRSHRLTRPDGTVLPLWSVSLTDVGLDYEAFHVHHDLYFSDSGGRWKRTPDPMAHPLEGRVQVLMHPIYWRGAQRFFFFLGMARSGSAWLANFLDRATNVTARHEFLLNHRFRDGRLTAVKHTGWGFSALAADDQTVSGLLRGGRAFFESQAGDQAEVNVYLDRFLRPLRKIFPEALVVHLHRDPCHVVRSLLDRGWYATPGDPRHPPADDVLGWENLSQFEKACWAIRRTLETLLAATPHRLRFERMVKDPEYLASRLGELGIVTYPRLAAAEHGKVINASSARSVAKPEKWGPELVAHYRQICGPVARRLGYPTDPTEASWSARLRGWFPLFDVLLQGARRFLRPRPSWVDPYLLSVPGGEVETIAELYFGPSADRVTAPGLDVKSEDGGLRLHRSSEGHGHLLFAGGTWHRAQAGTGWRAAVGSYYRGEVEVKCAPDGQSVIFCLSYADTGELASKQLVAVLTAAQDEVPFSFRVRSDMDKFNLALYFDAETSPSWLRLTRLRLERVAMRPPQITPTRD